MEYKKSQDQPKKRKRSKFLPILVIIGAIILILNILADSQDKKSKTPGAFWQDKVNHTKWIQIGTDTPTTLEFLGNYEYQITFPGGETEKDKYEDTEYQEMYLSVFNKAGNYFQLQGTTIGDTPYDIITSYYYAEDGRDYVAYQEFAREEDYDKFNKDFASFFAELSWDKVPTSGGYGDKKPLDKYMGKLAGDWESIDGYILSFYKNEACLNGAAFCDKVVLHENDDESLADIHNAKIGKENQIQGYTDLKFYGNKITALKEDGTPTVFIRK